MIRKLADLTVRPDWWDDAVCRDLGPERFFPDSDLAEAFEPAVKVCAGCPVAAPCLEMGMSFPGTPFGVWGGRTPDQLKSLHRKRSAARRAG